MAKGWMIATAMAFMPVAALAQATPAPAPALAPAPQYPARPSAELEALARQMYLFDQAAWHGTDAFREKWGSRAMDQLRGYIVVPGEDDLLVAAFYGEQDGKIVEFARFDVRVSDVVKSTIHLASARPELSPLAQHLVLARDTALAKAEQEGLGLCARNNPNTVVLPPDADGNVAVYIMTPQMENDVYPMGGHYRVDVDAAGKVRTTRPFMKSCFPLPYGQTRGSDQQVAAVLSHLLDPQPTEIHLFASYHLSVPLYVVTVDNGMIWVIANGRVQSSELLESWVGEPAPTT